MGKKAGEKKRLRELADAEKDEAFEPMERAVLVPNAVKSELDPGEEMFKNNLYTVTRRQMMTSGGFRMAHLSIRRNDRKPIKDWRHFQRIKNELAAPEWEGVEIYPAESRLVDCANQYHLWCFEQPLGIGFDDGRVVTDTPEKDAPGAVQRPHLEIEK